MSSNTPVFLLKDENGSRGYPWMPRATETLYGVVKIDGTTITAQNGIISAVGAGANTDLSNLTSSGNAKFQYAPFSINSGSNLDEWGGNNTLRTTGSAPSVITVEKYIVPQLSSNNSQYGICNDYTLTQTKSYSFSNFTNPWTIELAADNYIPAGAKVTWTMSTFNAGQQIEVAENFYYQTCGCSSGTITYTYTDDTQEVIYTHNGGAFTGARSYNIELPRANKTVKAIKWTGGGSITGYNPVYADYYNAWGITFKAQWQETISSADTLICAPCTITTADGKTKTFDTSSVLDCSDYADGDYKVLKSYEDGSLKLVNSLAIQKTQPASGLWLDNSRYPLMLKNFSVTGSPVISADGIASGFSSGNYLSIPMPNLSQANSWEIRAKFSINGLSNNYAPIFASSANNQVAAVTVDSNSKLAGAIGNSDGTNWQVNELGAWAGTKAAIQLNKAYWVKLVFTGTQYKILISENGKDYTETVYYNSTQKVTYNSSYNFNIGHSRALISSEYMNGSIDLKAFKIYVDNELVYEAVSNDVYIGDASVSGGLITAVSNNPFNWNSVTGSSSAMPSNRYIVLTLGASGSTYTAPADGWFFFFTVKSTAGYIQLYNSTIGVWSFSRAVYDNTTCGCHLPVKKGDVIRADYDGVNSNPNWKFIYAQGN